MVATQRWFLDVDGHSHVVEIDDAGLRRRMVWRRDDRELVSKVSGDERVHLVPSEDGPRDAGAVRLRFGALGPARRVTWFGAASREEAQAATVLSAAGLDFIPEPGSKAAAREEWIRTHPRLYTAQRSVVAVLSIAAALLVSWLLARFAFLIPLPAWDLPRVPWPDLPSIPWPEVRWPPITLPDWSMPHWISEVAEKAKFVFPVLLAFALARGELRRRRQQDEQRAQRVRSADRPPGTAEYPTSAFEAHEGSDKRPQPSAPSANRSTAGMPEAGEQGDGDPVE